MSVLARLKPSPAPVSARIDEANLRSRRFIANWRGRHAQDPDAFAAFSRLKHGHPVIGWVDCQAAGLEFALFHANDDIVAWEYLWFGPDAYEREIVETWVAWCRGAGVVLDVGGYSGAMSILAARANPAARVHMFEPMDRTAERAKINMRGNGVADRVTIHARAVSDQPGQAEILLYRNEDFLGTGNALDEKPGRAVKARKIIETVVPDRLLADVAPDVIKIDTEGHELACLRGMEAMIRRGRPRMIVEVWEPTRARVLQYLDDLGYECIAFEKAERPVMNFRCEPR